ncbi:hypothetical protein BEQ56_11180 [Anaerolineaceae bacterium oral taxon 439]|nr:hypothetical protein BEQ56_11180 [Anaerolineaceae bacterium oral taxon 439]
MKSKVSFLFILLILAVFAVSASAGAESEGGTLTIGLSVEPFTIDPAGGVYISEALLIQQIYDPLIFSDPEGELYPGLATEWSANDDGTEYSLKLRDDVRFHDGTPFTAEAVKAALDRAKDGLTPIAASPALLTTYAGTEIVDDTTVIVRFSETNATFLQDLSRAWLMIPAPTAGENEYIGTGPFVFESWAQQDSVTLRKNTAYNVAPEFMTHSGPAYLDEIIFRFLPEQATRAIALQTGEAQIVQDPSPVDALAMIDDPDYQVFTFAAPGVPAHQMINTEKFPTDDLNVRKAMNYAVDQDAIMEAGTMGLTPAAHGIITPTTWGYNADADNLYPFDLEKAKSILEEAGWIDENGDGVREKDGRKLTIDYPALPAYEEQFMELLAYALQDAGFEVNLMTMDDAGISAAGGAGEHNILNMGWLSRDPSVLAYMFLSSNIEGGSAYSRFRSDRLDEILTLAPKTVDADERKALYEEAQSIIMENALVIPIHAYSSLYIADTAVENFTFDAEGYPIFYNVSLAAE